MKDWPLLLAMNALLIAGWWKLFQKGMLLGVVGDWLWKRLPEMVCKPLFQCMPCMASIYGTAFYLLSPLSANLPLWAWPLHCLMLCALGSVLQRILDEH